MAALALALIQCFELVTPPGFGECAGPCVFVVLHQPLARKLVVAERNVDAVYFMLGALGRARALGPL